MSCTLYLRWSHFYFDVSIPGSWAPKTIYAKALLLRNKGSVVGSISLFLTHLSGTNSFSLSILNGVNHPRDVFSSIQMRNFTTSRSSTMIKSWTKVRIALHFFILRTYAPGIHVFSKKVGSVRNIVEETRWLSFDQRWCHFSNVKALII